MKVTLKREDGAEGLFKKKKFFLLRLGVELTEDETKALQAAGVEDYGLMDYTLAGHPFTYTVGDILRSSRKGGELALFKYFDQLERSEAESTLKDGLQKVKAIIDNQGALGEGEETFEL